MSMAATTTGEGSLVDVRAKYIPPIEPRLPALGVHITRLVDSYMVWVGVTEEDPETVQNAPQSGSLCRDWACAMPSPPGSTGVGPAASLFRSSQSDIAFSMSQRLARRFHKQIFLSVDIPPVYLTSVDGSRLLLEAEKGIVGLLAEF